MGVDPSAAACGPYTGCPPQAHPMVGRFHVDIRDADLLVVPQPSAKMQPVGFRVLKAPDGALLKGAMVNHTPMIMGPLPLAAVMEAIPVNWAVCNDTYPLHLRFVGEGSVVFELAATWTDVGGRLDVALRYGYETPWEPRSAWMYEPEIPWFLGGWTGP